MQQFDPAAEALRCRREAAKHYRRGRKDDRYAVQYAEAAVKAERMSKWHAERGETKEAESWDRVAASYLRMVGHYRECAPRSRENGRYYKQLARKYDEMAARR
jgi:hypothetical protein